MGDDSAIFKAKDDTASKNINILDDSNIIKTEEKSVTKEIHELK